MKSKEIKIAFFNRRITPIIIETTTRKTTYLNVLNLDKGEYSIGNFTPINIKKQHYISFELLFLETEKFEFLVLDENRIRDKKARRKPYVAYLSLHKLKNLKPGDSIKILNFNNLEGKILTPKTVEVTVKEIIKNDFGFYEITTNEQLNKTVYRTAFIVPQ